MVDMITHLHPQCTCNHQPGYPCNASCPVHLGTGLRSAEGGPYKPTEIAAREFAALDAMIRETHPRPGDMRACPGCDGPQHYTGIKDGWAHDALVDTWHCADPRKAGA